MMEIKIERIVDDGIRKIKIYSLNALREYQLPAPYFNGKHVFLSPDGSALLTDCSEQKGSGRSRQRLAVGEKLLPDEFENKLSFLRECGERLKMIREDIRKAEAEWTGHETYLI